MGHPFLRQPAIVAALLIATLCAAPANAQGDALQDANRLFKQGQLDRALDRVDGYLKTRPRDARARFLKGTILAEQNKPDEAIRILTGLTEDFPELPEPYNNLAVLYAAQGQYEQARSALETAIRNHPGYATAHENLGDVYAKMAGQAYDKAIQLDKRNTTAQTKLNLIKDLFVTNPRPAKTAPAGTGAAKGAAVATPAPTPAAANN